MISSFHTGFRPIIFSQILNVRAFLSVQNKSENHTMRVFYLLAIVFVVDGHTTLGNLFDLNGLFRYYSFHLMMFAFV